MAEAAVELDATLLDGIDDCVLPDDSGAGGSRCLFRGRVRRGNDTYSDVAFDGMREPQAVADDGAGLGRFQADVEFVLARSRCAADFGGADISAVSVKGVLEKGSSKATEPYLIASIKLNWMAFLRSGAS